MAGKTLYQMNPLAGEHIYENNGRFEHIMNRYLPSIIDVFCRFGGLEIFKFLEFSVTVTC
jgi:hypothetical protein